MVEARARLLELLGVRVNNHCKAFPPSFHRWAGLKLEGLHVIYKCNKYPEESFVMNIDFKKLSPTHTKDWYVKWIASIVLIVAQALTSAGGLAPYNLILFSIGLSGWLLVGYWWHDRALIVINSVGIFINITGILKFYMGV